MEKIRVLVNGCFGKMGRKSCQAIDADSQLELVGQTDLGDDLFSTIQKTQAQVVVDFTTAAAAFQNTEIILKAKVSPVIGTSGLLPEQVQTLQQLATEKQIGGVIAPNFALGAVLLMKFAAEASRYFPHVEILELHHDQKADAPSGTAMKTAELLAQNRLEKPKIKETEIYTGARGAFVHDIRVHSVRLPGLVAHQEVIFGGKGETLTLRHDSIHRESFMAGVCLASRKAPTLSSLYYGLEHIL